VQKYPIGIQNFQKLRQEGFVYVDKTRWIYELTQQAGYYFLSRPRRFGKSLLVSTLQALYEGRKELFDGLWIAGRWDFSLTNPIVAIYFNTLQLKGNPLDVILQGVIRQHAQDYQITLDRDLSGIVNQSGFLFQELIQKLHAKTGRKVVVLIDEYDKPIVDYLEDIPTAEANRDLLKSFYGILKPADEHLQLVLLTGVSRFSKVSVFSDLNNLNDISIDRGFSSMLGITQTELETTFRNEISRIAEDKNLNPDQLLAEVRHWYNGYGWLGAERVYNPFSLLNFFAKGGNFQNYWFSTGTPTWLVKLLYQQRLYDVGQIEVTDFSLNSFDLRQLKAVPLLFQTGYLTIESYSETDLVYTLNYPNQEVRFSLQQYLLRVFRGDEAEEVVPFVLRLRNALQTNDLATAIEIINVVFSSLPYDLWQRENERFYHALLHLTFVLLGVYVRSEVHTARGRCDALVETGQYIYAFEFKLDKTAQEALDQVESRGYLTPYAQSGKTRIGVGVNFSTELKAVESWVVKQY